MLLLVEDDAASARALTLILRRCGWQVDVVDTVGGALSYLESHTPAAVLLDLMLPDGSGTTVLRWIRERGLKVPVTITTASSDPGPLNEAHALGVRAIVRKPIDVAELLKLLEG
jgi:DNA-binding response OmpR family regulator